MAYQKLQVERALEVIPSDTINIPNVSGAVLSGTTSQAAPVATQLVDNTQDFTLIQGLVGSIVYVGKDVATVASVTNATTLTLSAGIMSTLVVSEYVIYADANQGCVLYTGAGGDIKVLTAGNDEVTFTGTAAGAFIPVQVKRVFATPAPPAGIIALW
jgi:hypothetical protein